jgi:hypothetical protein
MTTLGRHWPTRIALVLLILVGLGVAADVVADQVRLRRELAACRNPNPNVRLKALERFAQERDARAGQAIAEALDRQTERAVLEMVGYAAMRIGDTALLEALQRVASQGPDDPIRAKLILYTARLSRRDARLIPWLEAGLSATQEPWRQAGSATGLLQVGEPRGGPALIAIARQADQPVRVFAMNELRGLVEPMTETVGWPIHWPAANAEPDAAFWASLEAFWAQHGTARLLNDVLTRRYDRATRLYELNRLLHARDKVAKWFE